MVIDRKRGVKMKIKSKLEDLMWDKRIKSINQLSLDTGITRPTLTRLKENKSDGIRLETLEKLCHYFQCELTDLLEIEKEEVK